MPEENDTITIGLNVDQAVVLFEWLLRENPAEEPRLRFEDPSEQRVLWWLEGQLEKAIPFLFSTHYADKVAEARRRVTAGPLEGGSESE